MTWDANRVWTAVDNTYAHLKKFLGENPSARIDPEREINPRSVVDRRAVYSHLVWMSEEIKTLAAKGDLEKSQRWLGFVQGVSWALGLVKLSDLRTANRREAITAFKVDDYVQCLGEAQDIFRIAKISEGVQEGTGIAFLCTYKGDSHGWEDLTKLRPLGSAKKIEAWKVKQLAYEMRKNADRLWSQERTQRATELHREAALLEDKAYRLEHEA